MRSTPDDDRGWPAPDRHFVERVLSALGLTALVAAVALLVWAAHQVLLVVFCGVLLAILLDGLAGLLARHLPISRWWTVRALIVVLAGAVAVVGWIWGDSLVQQTVGMGRELPAAFEQLRESLRENTWGRIVARRMPDPGQLLSRVDIGRLTGAFSSVVGAIASLFIILFVGLYGALSPHRYVDNAARLVPPDSRERAMEVAAACHHALQLWLLGRLADMAILSVMTAVGLFLLGVPYAVPLGVVAGLLAFVPYVGPLLSVVPAVLVALGAGSGSLVLSVLLLYAGIQFVESYFVTPLIEQKAVEVPPAMTLSIQAVMGVLAGGVGVVVATPLAVVVIVLIQTLYLQDAIHEDVQVIGEPDRG